MRIILAEHFGMCFGVRDAIAQAEDLAAEAPLTILGELVHNSVVRERLRARGIQEIGMNDAGFASRAAGRPLGENPTTAPSLPATTSENLTALSRQVSRDGHVMITAHGASDAKREELRIRGFNVADATCPLVHHAHNQLRLLVDAGFFPVVIGKAGHVEVEGLIGDFPDAVVLSSSEDVDRLPERARYGIISQTTQPITFVRQVVECIRNAHPESEVRFIDTVCKPTKDRQSALRKLIGETDAIVVVGGRTSNNTQQLVATCRAAGRTAFHVERPDELRSEWFAGVEIVGLTAGTSTLPETVAAVFSRLEQIGEAKT